MGDMMSKITGSQNIVEKLASKIPGFGGYLQQEQRRTADKMLREALAQRYDEQWGRISDIQRQMIGEGMIDNVDNMEAAAIKLRNFIDAMKTASYGYTGFFGAVKIEEAELEKLYNYDNVLLEGVTKVANAVDNVQASLGSDGLPAAIRNLTAVCADCVTAFERRKDVLTSS